MYSISNLLSIGKSLDLPPLHVLGSILFQSSTFQKCFVFSEQLRMCHVFEGHFGIFPWNGFGAGTSSFWPPSKKMGFFSSISCNVTSERPLAAAIVPIQVLLVPFQRQPIYRLYIIKKNKDSPDEMVIKLPWQKLYCTEISREMAP